MPINNPEYIIVHHSFSDDDQTTFKSEASFNNGHKARGFPKSTLGWYIGYQYVVYSDGEVKMYRREDEAGAHCKEASMNFKSIGICLEGKFDTGFDIPKPEQLNSVLILVKSLQEHYKIPDDKVVPHRYFATYKSCWGSSLPNNVMQFLKAADPFDLSEVPEYAKTSWAKANKKGILTKDPNNFLTRADFSLALDRLGLL